MNGVLSYDERLFPLLSDKNCVERAIKSVEGVKFVNLEEKTESAKTLLGKDIQIKIYNFYYRIDGLSIERAGNASVFISEDKTDDPTSSYNKVTYVNKYGYMNGREFTKDEFKLAHPAVQKVNDAVWKTCKISTRIPEVSDH